MESWFSCGEGFDSVTITANRRIAKAEKQQKYINHSKKRKNSVWHHNDFMSTFSVEDKKCKVSSPDDEVISWSESSSDNEEKTKVKTEPNLEDHVSKTIHQDSCHIKRSRFRRKSLAQKKNNTGDIGPSRKVMFMNTSRYKQGSSSREVEFPTKSLVESKLSERPHPLPVTRPLSAVELKLDDTQSVGKSHLSENERTTGNILTHLGGLASVKILNQWTSPTFDFDSSTQSMSIKSKSVKKGTKIKRQKINCSGESTESLPPDIEDCVSSCSDGGSVDDLRFDDFDDDADDYDADDDKEIKEHKQTGRLVERDIRSRSSFGGNKQRSSELSGRKTSMFQVTCMESEKCNILCQEAPGLNDPESQSIIMSESPMSQESQPNVSGLSSSASSKSSQKIGASHWASVFQRQVSPPREEQTMPGNEDSGKKKRKKYVSDVKSLAGQLARLVSREKSAIRFWDHSLNAGSLEGKPKKYLTVRIKAISRQFSFSVCDCDVLDGQPVSAFSACKVLISGSSAVKIGLKTDMTLQIFPPWQQMDDGKNVTLLCTNYLRGLTDNDGSPTLPVSSQSPVPHASLSKSMASISSPKELEKESKERDFQFKWSCPCSHRDKSVSITSCPASKVEFIPLNNAPPALLLSPQTVTLHSVKSSAPSHNSSGCQENTLLESIEKAHQFGNCLPPFVSVVLRVFRLKSDESNNVSIVLLIEDASGTLAFVSHCEELYDVVLTNSLFASLMKEEGRQCICGGLRVQQRISKEKDPSLFSVISQCWLQRKPIVTSQDSLDQDYPNWQVKVPTFCYVLQPSSSDLPKIESKNEHEQPVKIELLQLQQRAEVNSSQRFSSVVIALNWEVISKSNKNCRFVAFDPSPSSEFTSSYRISISEDCMNIFWSEALARTSLCLLKDVILKNGILYCDKFSSLIAQSFWETLGIEEKLDVHTVQSARLGSLQLPPLTSSANPGDIVSLSGSISSVDEESSYSWQACDKCGSEITLSSKHTRIFCATCHQPVEKTVAKMTMTVMMNTEQIPKNVAVKISLNTTTMKLVLPDEVDEEGYDVEHVLGKNVKAAACIVETRSPGHISLEQLDL